MTTTLHTTGLEMSVASSSKSGQLPPIDPLSPDPLPSTPAIEDDDDSLDWVQLDDVEAVPEASEEQELDLLPATQQEDSRHLAAFAAHAPPCFASALSRALHNAGIPHAEALVNAWAIEVTAATSTPSQIDSEAALADQRDASYKRICQEEQVTYPGMVRPCRSAHEGTGVMLAWPPWHADRHVLTTLKHTPRLVLQTGFAGFALDLLETKMEGVDHAKLPPPDTDPTKLASNFPMGRKDAGHLSALSRMLSTSLDRCRDVCVLRAAFPSFTIAQGKHVELNAETFLSKVHGLQQARISIDLSSDALFTGDSRLPVQLPARVFLTNGQQPRLLGVFVYCVHGSQGRYLRGRGGEVALTAAYALDVALDYAVSLQRHAKPTPRRFAHTLAAWPAHGLTEWQFQFELRQLRRRELEGGASPGSLADLPAAHIHWIEQLGLKPPAATKNSGSQTILSRYCSALSSYYRKSLSPEKQKRRREKIAETVAGWSPEFLAELKIKRHNAAVKAGAANAKRIRELDQDARDAENLRNFETKDEWGVTRRDKIAVTKWLKKQDRLDKLEQLQGQETEGPEVSIDRQTPYIEAKEPTDELVCASLEFDRTSRCFRWCVHKDHKFGDEDVTADGLREDGKHGQLFTPKQFERCQNLVSAYYATELWFCKETSLVWPMPTRRELVQGIPADAVPARNNSKVVTVAHTRNCVMCDYPTTGVYDPSNGKTKPVRCRPITGWQSWTESIPRQHSTGPKKDVEVPGLQQRVRIVDDIPPNIPGKKAQKTHGHARPKLAPLHVQLDAIGFGQV